MLTLNLFAILLIFLRAVLSSCPQGFDLVNSKCLKITDHKSTHHKAETACQELNSHIVFIQNAIDNRAVLNYASNITSPLWIGVTCKVNKSPEDCKWDDGSTVEWNNFLPGYPVTNIGSCVYLDPANQPLKGRWVSATCQLDEFYAICEATS